MNTNLTNTQMKKETISSRSFPAKEVLTVIGILAICGTVAFSMVMLKNTGIQIQNAGGVTESGALQNSISVSGEGRVMAKPDLVRISAGVSEIGKTTKEAQEKANKKLNQIISILEENGVAKKHLQTQRLSFYPEYDWHKDDGRELVGQRAEQTLSIQIHDIDKDEKKVTNILDALGNIDGLRVNSVNFDINDKEGFFSQAREKAFEKAEQKAKELARMGNVKLLKPITISESSMNYQPPMLRNYAKMEMVMDSRVSSGSSLPSGELEVTATISVVYGIK